MVFHSRREFKEAAEHIEKALAICDANAIHWNNYGVVLKDRGDHKLALKAFEKAVSLRPDYADAWSNVGLMQAELGHLKEAEGSIRQALNLEPKHPDALRHLAVVFREKGDLQEALRLCEDAAAVAPNKAETHDVKGRILRASGKFEDAATAFEMARQCNPNADDVQLNLGFAYADLDETEKAREAFAKAAEIRQDRPTWKLRHLGLCPSIFQSSTDIHEYRAQLERQLSDTLDAAPSFDWKTILRDGFIPSFQLSHHGVCNRKLKEKFANLFVPHFPRRRPKRKPRNKIRIGFACTRYHQGGFVRGFGGVMERLDRNRFDVIGLVSQDVVSVCRSRVRTNDVTWLGFPHNLEQAFRVFEQAECDVVVHWTPGTDNMNYFLPFLPLARVQCIGFGMHGTTGIPGIDYCVSSKLFERGPEAAEDYTEQLVQFESATCWQERPQVPSPASRSDFGLPASGPLFFCPQRMAKFHPDFDPILKSILETVTDGHVCVLSGIRPRACRILGQRFEKTMGESLARRILFVPTQGAGNYLRLLSVMDVVLDMPTYSAALTGYDAFGIGIPVVTRPGTHMVERYADGLYRQMRLAHLVARDDEEYVDLAARLANDSDYRAHVKQQIQQHSSSLYQDPLVVQEYEQFFSKVAGV